MLVSKAQLTVRHAASKDTSRYNLNGIRFEADGRTVATDGHRLYTVTAEVPSDDDYPNVADVENTSEPLEPFILPSETADRVRKAIPKKQRAPILEYARLDVASTNANGSARFVTTDIENAQVVEGRKIEGEFPDWRKVMPEEGKAQVTVTLNWQYLADIGKALNEFAPGSRGKAVKLEITDALSPVKFTATDPDSGAEFTGIIMPMRA